MKEGFFALRVIQPCSGGDFRKRNSIEWLERALNSPDKTAPDLEDGDLRHYLKVIPENGGRVLRVVVNFKVTPFRVVTVFFDRAMKGKL